MGDNMKKMNTFLGLLFTLVSYSAQAREVTLNDIQCIQTVGEIRYSSVSSDRFVEASASCAQNIAVTTYENQRIILSYFDRGYAEATLGEKGLAGFTLAFALPLVAARVKVSATSNAQSDLAFQTERILLSKERCNAQEQSQSLGIQTENSAPDHNP